MQQPNSADLTPREVAGEPARNDGAQSGVAPLELVTELLRYRRHFIVIPFLAAVLFVSYVLFLPRKYTSTLSFVPQVSDAGLGGAGAIAAQLGVAMPGVDLTQTPDFYASLLRSDQISRDLVVTPYLITDKIGVRRYANIVSILGVKSSSGARSRDDAADLLRRKMRVSSSLKTGEVQLDVVTDDPSLSWQIAVRALELVNEFNTTTRQSRYGGERRFLVTRLAESKQSLRTAEDAYQAFLDNNRDFAASPPLLFVRDRLQREVNLRSTIYNNFAQQLEDARVQEARNTPVITVVDKPKVPSRPNRRGLAFKSVATAVLASVLLAFVIIARFFIARQGERPDVATQQFAVQWHESIDEIRSMWWRIRNIGRRRRVAT